MRFQHLGLTLVAALAAAGCSSTGANDPTTASQMPSELASPEVSTDAGGAASIVGRDLCTLIDASIIERESGASVSGSAPFANAHIDTAERCLFTLDGGTTETVRLEYSPEDAFRELLVTPTELNGFELSGQGFRADSAIGLAIDGEAVVVSWEGALPAAQAERIAAQTLAALEPIPTPAESDT